jgi:hypothetical protein
VWCTDSAGMNYVLTKIHSAGMNYGLTKIHDSIT